MSDMEEARADEARRLAISTAQAHVTRAIDAIESVGGGALTERERALRSEAEEALYALYGSLQRRRT